MRLLHTADWHLGRIFYGTYLTDDQAYVLEGQLLDIVKAGNIDGIVIAGDIFDRSVPPVEAVELWDTMLTRLSKDYHIPLFVVSGNHDGPERIEVGRALLESSNVYLWGTPEHCHAPLVYEFHDGPLAICPMPFHEPQRIARALPQIMDGEEHGHVDYDYVYQQWARHLHSQIPSGTRSLAISHAFVSGGEVGGSERVLSVGGSEIVHPTAFKDFHYTALGHLHGAQRMGADHIRYSGSPLKYSFDEHKQDKSFTIVDMDVDGHVSIEQVPIIPKRDVVVLEGYFEDILNHTDLRTAHSNDYVMVRLLDEAPVIDGMAKLRQCYPYCMTIDLAGRMAQQTLSDTVGTYRNLNERQLFNQFAEAVWHEPLSTEEQQYIDGLWNRIVKEE